MQIVNAVIALGLLGLIFGVLLAMAARFFAVKEDPRIGAVQEVLPGANCGACGYAGCANFAAAVVKQEADLNGCIPGGQETAFAIAEVLGQEVEESVAKVSTLFCLGDCEKAEDRFVYDGVQDCAVAANFFGGHKGCRFGCLGLGNCVRVCPFDAIEMGEHGLPVVDPEVCNGCGLCVKACPRDLLKLLPNNVHGHLVLCSSHDRGKKVSKVCSIGCIACKACVKACPQEAITMEDNLAVINMEKCDDCGKCTEVCPPKTIYARFSMPEPKQLCE